MPSMPCSQRQPPPSCAAARSALPLAALLLLLLLGPTSAGTPSPDSPANPAATVRWGAARFTVLAPALLRLELAGKAGFDDRSSLAVVNRSPTPSPPPFSVSTTNDTLTLTTSALELVYRSPGGNSSIAPPNSTCANPQNADVADGSRVPSYPFGLNVTDQGGCCSACDADEDCQVWIYDPTTGDRPNCWLMVGVTALYPSGGRVSGGLTPFPPGSLNVTLTFANGTRTTWTPTTAADPSNLLGAFHALDCYDIPANCVQSYDDSQLPGLLSRSGWFVLDDTSSARLIPPSALPNPTQSLPIPYWYANSTKETRPTADWYFFGHGTDYRSALRDYASIGGAYGMPPYSAVGVWWSHWQKFNQSFFASDILGNYAGYDLPLHHTVLDVDWHTESQDPRCYSYGGFTVNSALWPDWEGFVDSLTDGTNPTGRPLKLLLNLHPQGGFDVCQANWPAFAALIDADPNSTSPIPCSFGNPAIASALYTAFMDAEPLTQVAAWWTDFDYMSDCFDAPTASTPSSYPGIAWSNEVFGEHQRVARGRRPWLLSRSGGLGAHRHSIHFTGDANQHQDILHAELRMTPRAANVLDATISHDIGGFMCQSLNATDCDSEPSIPHSGLLYLRWIQAGVTWPVFRTHASEWGLMERRIWQFPAEFPYMADAFRLRNAFMPYLYSALRAGVATGVAPVHPVYYDRPEDDEAYVYDTQHMFGDYVLASPIYLVNETAPGPGGVGLGNTKPVWLPPTTTLANAGAGWSDWNGTTLYAGPVVVDGVFYSLADIPLFGLAGCPVPTKTMASVANVAADPVVWVVFPSPATAATACSATLYEDDGETNAFEEGASAATPATVAFAPASSAGGTGAPTTTTLTIGPTSGSYAGMPGARTYAAQFRGFVARAGAGAAPAAVLVNGAAIPQVPFPSQGGLAPSSEVGWFLVPAEANHTLAQPAGSLVAFAGAFAASDTVVVELQW